MKPHCMIVVQYLLPAIRVIMLKKLMDNYNMRKIDASTKMELTPAAITQYLKGERGAAFVEKIEKSEKTMRIISELAQALASDRISAERAIDKLCEACGTIRAEGIICELHKDNLPGLKEGACAICERSVC